LPNERPATADQRFPAIHAASLGIAKKIGRQMKLIHVIAPRDAVPHCTQACPAAIGGPKRNGTKKLSRAQFSSGKSLA
jgi:hypothetical protein